MDKRACDLGAFPRVKPARPIGDLSTIGAAPAEKWIMMAQTTKKRASTQPNPATRLKALLAELAGEERGGALAAQLATQPAQDVARSLIASPSFRRYYKERLTGDIGRSGPIDADPGYVGMANLDLAAPFAAQFETCFRPRLARRADGFGLLFEQLAGRRAPLIIETGCLRIPDNWEGDGQSSFLFDCFVRGAGGSLISIDLNPESVESARRACSSATTLILNDSVAALHMLSLNGLKPASLIYLDSFDLDHANPMPSAIHHILELAAVRPLIGPGTLICIDDYGVGGQADGGKGMIVDQFMNAVRARVLYSGYQKIWQLID